MSPKSILIVATGNSHKAREIGRIIGESFAVLTLKDIGFTDQIVESGKTFEANAEIKLRAVADFVGQNPIKSDVYNASKPEAWLLADDSGIEVDVLNGAPGVISARYAGEPCNDEANNTKLLGELKGVAGYERSARFRCVLAVAKLTEGGSILGEIRFFSGSCPGKIGFEPKGTNGFGYDPIFFPEGFCRTYADLTEDEKNQISHRAKALSKFKEWLLAAAIGK
jgi:XTP/dITP diphosphohydrolase